MIEMFKRHFIGIVKMALMKKVHVHLFIVIQLYGTLNKGFVAIKKK